MAFVEKKSETESGIALVEFVGSEVVETLTTPVRVVQVLFVYYFSANKRYIAGTGVVAYGATGKMSDEKLSSFVLIISVQWAIELVICMAMMCVLKRRAPTVDLSGCWNFITQHYSGTWFFISMVVFTHVASTVFLLHDGCDFSLNMYGCEENAPDGELVCPHSI